MGFKPPLGPVGQVGRIDVTHPGPKERKYTWPDYDPAWWAGVQERRAKEDVLRDIVGPPDEVPGDEGRSLPWPRIWCYAWRLAGMLAWAGGCWLLAELV